MRRISWLAEQLLTFQGGLCFTELFPRAAKLFQSYKPLLRNQTTRPFSMSDGHTIFLPAPSPGHHFQADWLLSDRNDGTGKHHSWPWVSYAITKRQSTQISALSQTLQRQGSSVITVTRPRLYKVWQVQKMYNLNLPQRLNVIKFLAPAAASGGWKASKPAFRYHLFPCHQGTFFSDNEKRDGSLNLALLAFQQPDVAASPRK